MLGEVSFSAQKSEVKLLPVFSRDTIRSVPLFLTMDPLTKSSQEVPVSEGFQANPCLKLTPFPPEGYFQLIALAPILWQTIKQAPVSMQPSVLYVNWSCQE